MAVERLTGGAARDEAGRIARFLAVGGTGFLVDAAVLAVMTELLSVGALPGRTVSFSVAVLSTWLLNRRWSFRTREAPSWGEFLRYLTSQGTGLSVNLAVFVTLGAFAPDPASRPLVALAVASMVAMIVNYLGLRFVVFGLRRRAVE